MARMQSRRDVVSGLMCAAACATSPLGALAENQLGSLAPFIEDQVRPASLSFLMPQFTSLSGWKASARSALLDHLVYAPEPTQPEPRVVSRTDRGAYFEELLWFSTGPNVRVPAYVLIPKNGKLPAPAIVALHDHGAFFVWGKEKLVATDNEHPSLREFKANLYAGQSVASDLASRGYVVIVIDMFYWGERRLLLSADPEEFKDRSLMTEARVREFNVRSAQSVYLTSRALAAAGVTWPGVMVWDDIRTVDYLVTRPEVDRDRIGCIGLSIGAFRAAHLAALDSRIKASVIVCWMTSFSRQLNRLNGIDFVNTVPGLFHKLDYPDVVSMGMPAATLVVSGSQDTLFDEIGVKEAARKVQACYAKAGIPQKFRFSLYAAPHEFNAEMQAEARNWLSNWLG
jgi:dienelactone hydrolase